MIMRSLSTALQHQFMISLICPGSGPRAQVLSTPPSCLHLSLYPNGKRDLFLDRHLVYASTVKGSEWASYNSGQLYMTLSEPCKTIMHSCRKYACNLVKDGFDLRLSIWSQASEREHMKNTIAHLDDQVFPPNFVMGLGRWPRWLQTKGDGR